MRHPLHASNLRKKAQWEQGDQVVVHGLQSIEGQRLNGMQKPLFLLIELFCTVNDDHFAKTGSGQT